MTRAAVPPCRRRLLCPGHGPLATLCLGASGRVGFHFYRFWRQARPSATRERVAQEGQTRTGQGGLKSPSTKRDCLAKGSASRCIGAKGRRRGGASAPEREQCGPAHLTLIPRAILLGKHHTRPPASLSLARGCPPQPVVLQLSYALVLTFSSPSSTPFLSHLASSHCPFWNDNTHPDTPFSPSDARFLNRRSVPTLLRLQLPSPEHNT